MKIQIEIDPLMDGHLHVRRGEMMKKVLPHTIAYCDYALLMPNTNPPIVTMNDVRGYDEEVRSALPPITPDTFTPLFAVQLTSQTTAQTIQDAFEDESDPTLAVKYYPPNVTHGASDVLDLLHMKAPLRRMSDLHVPLCLHAEVPHRSHMDAEVAFIPIIQALIDEYPNLPICVGPVSTAAMVEAILSWPERIVGSITAHHLLLTIDDVLGAKLYPHHFCKPVAKTEHDRQALRHVAFEGHPKFFYGSDSAPHPRNQKESAAAPPGIYSAPTGPLLLLEEFLSHGCRHQFKAFTRLNACAHYKLEPETSRRIVLISNTEDPPELRTIPTGQDPEWFYSGRTCDWRIAPTR